MDNIDTINKHLKQAYGQDDIGRPLYRVAWSEQTEKRFGTFERVTKGGIFLGRETGVFEVRKYNYIKERWILEKLTVVPNPEVRTDTPGTYEPLFVFQDKRGDYLPPRQWACDLILHTLLYGRRRTASETMSEEDKQFEKEVEKFQDYLGENSSYLSTMLANREAVVNPGLPEEK